MVNDKEIDSTQRMSGAGPVCQRQKMLVQTVLRDGGAGVVVGTQPELKPSLVVGRDLHSDVYRLEQAPWS